MEEIWSPVFLYRAGISWLSIGPSPISSQKKNSDKLILEVGREQTPSPLKTWKWLPPVWLSQKKKKKRISFGVILSYSLLLHCGTLLEFPHVSEKFSCCLQIFNMKSQAASRRAQLKIIWGKLQSLILLLVTFYIFFWLSSKPGYIFHSS